MPFSCQACNLATLSTCFFSTHVAEFFSRKRQSRGDRSFGRAAKKKMALSDFAFQGILASYERIRRRVHPY